MDELEQEQEIEEPIEEEAPLDLAEIEKTLKEIQENLDSRTEFLLEKEEALKAEKELEEAWRTSQGEFQNELSAKIDTLNSTVQTSGDNTVLVEKLETIINQLDSLNGYGLSINEVGSSIGMYALIVIPAVGVIWVLYKLIHMWIKPFI